MAVRVKINGETRDIDAPEDMPLLWALRQELGMVAEDELILKPKSLPEP